MFPYLYVIKNNEFGGILVYFFNLSRSSFRHAKLELLIICFSCQIEGGILTELLDLVCYEICTGYCTWHNRAIGSYNIIIKDIHL